MSQSANSLVNKIYQEILHKFQSQSFKKEYESKTFTEKKKLLMSIIQSIQTKYKNNPIVTNFINQIKWALNSDMFTPDNSDYNSLMKNLEFFRLMIH